MNNIKKTSLLRKFIIIQVILLATLLVFGQQMVEKDEPDEIIRRKIENQSLLSLTALGEKIYCTQSITMFYQQRGFQPAWNDDLRKQLLEGIENAYFEGLHPKDYHLIKIKTLFDQKEVNGRLIAEADILMSDAFLLLASHMLSGKVNPETIDAEWHVVRREGDPVKALSEGINSQNIASTLEQLCPIQPVYQGLKIALKRYLSMDTLVWANIPEGKMIKKGESDQRIPTIQKRLIFLGDFSKENQYNGEEYNDLLFDAIIRFQERHGLEADGAIGPKTIAAMNIPVLERINQIKVNMERWRWLPREFGDYYIKVNIANFYLDIFHNGRLVLNTRIIAGKPYRQTPVFSSRMQYIVFNPTWTVPPGILNADILPAVRKDAGYLAKKKLKVLDSQGNEIDPANIDWNSNAPKSFTYRQASGPDNALGLVKFMFPNKFHIYLHDTPAKELFKKSERAFSSGCIRVFDPLNLATFLLKDQPEYNHTRIDKIIASGKTETVLLKSQPMVYLLYWTAWTDSQGIVQFRKDIYERDAKLMLELDQPPPVIN